MANTTIKEKGLKVCYGLIGRLRDCKASAGVKIFKSIVCPILSYASEVWASYYVANINESNLIEVCDKPVTENISLKLAKFVIWVHKGSSNLAVRGELGLFPTLISQTVLMFKYWFQVSQAQEDTLLSNSYKECLDLIKTGKPCWLTGIKSILNHCELPGLWDRVVNNPQSFKNKPNMKRVKSCLEKEYSIKWLNHINRCGEGNKLRTYATFKKTFNLENYLLTINCKEKRSSYTKLRISSHNLMIERGRHMRPKKLEVQERICRHCDTGQIEDEMHFMMRCPLYKENREIMWNSLCDIMPSFENLDEMDQFKMLMSNFDGDQEVSNIVAKYIQVGKELKEKACTATSLQAHT
jgi:hypothetical protein